MVTHVPSSEGKLKRIRCASDACTKLNAVLVRGASGCMSTNRARCHAVGPACVQSIKSFVSVLLRETRISECAYVSSFCLKGDKIVIFFAHYTNL